MEKGRFLAVLLLTICLTIFAGINAALAQDDASDAVYDDGWGWGDNGGSGFGPWELYTSGNAGHFVWTSTTNGDGDSNGDGDIDVSGEAWGMWANSGGQSDAVRPLTSALDVAEGISLRMDTGWIDGGGSVGISLQNGNGSNIFDVYFNGGDSFYTVAAAAIQTSTIGFTDEGLEIEFILTGVTTFSVTLTHLWDGYQETLTGTLRDWGDGQDVSKIRFFNFNAGFNNERNAYFNSIQRLPKDSDFDGIPDATDPCPLDPDNDADGDGVCGDIDNCPNDANAGQEDADGDGTGDVCDTCTDTDGDGYGNPGYPANTCAEDNCPYVANPGQEDADGDNIGDVCDTCTDTDGDGYGNPGYDTSGCTGGTEEDNCPDDANPGQEDTDSDGVGDVCDTCTDTDGDGYGDPGYNTFGCSGGTEEDNCPDDANPGQEDTDNDGIGDVCDTCTDTDGDGYGNPGYPANTCAEDNCPFTPNPGQEDTDNDGIGDACDGCPDIDGDTVCDPDDNCPNDANPGQEDTDHDGIGNVCDICPNDPDDDVDGDGVCGEVDNCPNDANAGQEDADGDGIGDVCDTCTDTDNDGYGDPGYPANTCADDNCPNDANPGQEDADNDGIGDVCDTCTDTDGDGYGDPGYPANTCAEDNCPDNANPGQEDGDGDDVGDVCDNCPDDFNPGQEDNDNDGLGNVCEPPQLIVTMDAEFSGESGGSMKAGDRITGGDAIGPGDILLIKVLIENTGYIDATGVMYTTDSFEHVTLTVGSVTTTLGWIVLGNTIGDTSIEIDIGTIPAGVTVLITYEIVINDPLLPGVTVIEHEGTVTSNETGEIPAENIHTEDGITRIYIGDPILSVYIEPAFIIEKPDSQFRVCIEIDSATAEMAIYDVYALITFDSTILDSVKVPTFEGTLLDSLGWDLKWHYYPGTPDSLELFLIGGGKDGLIGKGPIVCWEFRVSDAALPGDTATIRFSKFWFNEGQPMSETENAMFMVNRPPVLTWNGVIAPDTIDAIYLQESNYYEFLADAHDPDGDEILLWAQTDTECPWSESATFCGRKPTGGPPYIIPPFSGEEYIDALFKFHPPKLGVCDTFWVDFFAMSTHTTGQPLYDSLSVHFIVDNCDIMAAWGVPPPDTYDVGDPTAPYSDGDVDLPFDTLDVYACGEYEFPITLHFDYPDSRLTPIWALYMILDYDTRLELFEVGNEGLITENAGALTYRVDDGKIFIAMAFNDTLENFTPDTFEVCPWYHMAYVGFRVPDNLAPGTILNLSVDHVKVNEGDPTSCWVDYQYLKVRDFAVIGRVFYSDTDTLWVPDVTVATVNECGGEASFVDVTDDAGWFESLPWPGCSDFCLEPSRENDLTVEDQIVTSLDAVMILRSLCGQIILSHNDMLAADVTGDSTVSAFDAATIMKWVVCENCGTELLPDENIGDWIFEYYGDLTDQHGESCVCYTELVTDHLYELFETVIIGDVTQNWMPEAAPKVVAGDLPLSVAGNRIDLTFGPEAHAVDLALSCEGLEISDVKADADILEWAKTADGIRVAAAAVNGVGDVTVTFTAAAPAVLEATALVNESQVLTTTAKVVPVPTEYSLSQNYPNPFNPITDIRYGIPDSRYPIHTTLKIYNILGQEVKTLVSEVHEPGYYVVTWDGKDTNGVEVSSGVYFYRIQANDYTATKRMVLMK